MTETHLNTNNADQDQTTPSKNQKIDIPSLKKDYLANHGRLSPEEDKNILFLKSLQNDTQIGIPTIEKLKSIWKTALGETVAEFIINNEEQELDFENIYHVKITQKGIIIKLTVDTKPIKLHLDFVQSQFLINDAIQKTEKLSLFTKQLDHIIEDVTNNNANSIAIPTTKQNEETIE